MFMLRLSDTYVRITDTCNVCIYCYCTFIVTLEMHNFHTCFSASCCCIFSLPIVEFVEHQQQQQKHWFKTAESAKLYLVAWQWIKWTGSAHVLTLIHLSVTVLNFLICTWRKQIISILQRIKKKNTSWSRSRRREKSADRSTY